MEQYQSDSPYTIQPATAPYAVTSLVLGILSLVLSGLGITLIMGIIGLLFANKGLRAVGERPGAYSGIGMLEAGKVMSIVSIVLSGLVLVLVVLVVVLVLVLGVWAIGESF